MLYRPSFRQTALALTAGAILAATAAFPAAAQQAAAPSSQQASTSRILTEPQCRSAKGATLRTLEEFTGKMSASLAQSLGRFSASCDLSTKFDLVPGQDDKAWDTFRVRLNYIRTSNASVPATLAQK
jgi:long-subunit fatty acid transport protein